MPILTIAGAPSADWKEFTKHITLKTGDGFPREGSIGICYGLDTNPVDLYLSVQRNDIAFQTLFLQGKHRTNGSPNKPTSLKYVLEYVKFVLGQTDTFVIRKGKKALYIATKISTAYFDKDEQFPVRFKYRVIGPATSDIQEAIDSLAMGAIMPAVYTLDL